MSQATLEQRVAALEALVASLVAKRGGAERRKNWRDSIGMFPDHAGLKDIAAAGAAIRKAERQEFRKSQVPVKRRKRIQTSK